MSVNLRRMTFALATLIIGAVAAFLVAQLARWNHNVSFEDPDSAFTEAPAPPLWVAQFMNEMPIGSSWRYRRNPVEVMVWMSEHRRASAMRFASQTRSGWPFLAFEGTFTDEIPPNAISINPTRAALCDGEDWGMPESAPNWVPAKILVRPLWAGFVGNTLIFATFIAGAAATVRTLLQWKARRDKPDASVPSGS